MVHTVHIRIFFSVFINNIDLIYFFYSSSSVQKEKERDQVSDQWNWTELNTITRNSQWRGWCALMCSTVEKREKSNKQTNLFQSTTKTYTYEPLPLIFCCSFAQPRAHPSVHILYLKIILQTNKFQNSFFLCIATYVSQMSNSVSKICYCPTIHEERKIIQAIIQAMARKKGFLRWQRLQMVEQEMNRNRTVQSGTLPGAPGLAALLHFLQKWYSNFHRWTIAIATACRMPL